MMETVRKRLKKVMNFIAGLDLVRTNLVKDIGLKNDNVRPVGEPPVRPGHKG